MQGEDDEDAETRMERAFAKALKTGKAQAVHVDMHAELSKLGLEKLIPAESWPQARLGVASGLRRMAVAVFDVQANAVKKLASKARLCKNQGQEKVFLFVDLRECVLRFGARLLFASKASPGSPDDVYSVPKGGELVQMASLQPERHAREDIIRTRAPTLAH